MEINFLWYLVIGVSEIKDFQNVCKSVAVALKTGYRSFECNPICEREENFGLVLQELLPKFNLKRCDVFIIGKLHPKNYGENTEKAFWQTCRNLKTDYLDAYLMQWPGGYNEDPDNDVNLIIRLETWKEMIKLKKNGRVRNIGVCNFDIKHLEDFKSLELDVPAINQVEFHPRCPQKNLLNYCKENNILLQATSFKNTFHPLLLSDDTIRFVGNKINKTSAQVLLKWILNKGVAVIPQSINPKDIINNYLLYDFFLEKPEMDSIDSITKREKYLMNPSIVF
ncbi:2,5-diketo-D-gluconic acid reductase A, putative [Pediculus humanus corporis]|uniref:2,5-diketo-D-gluconic acid reductase A, putative n=1 Tax=Pediculus humanus subsp. corporis TaxID=121224 RepID=E0VK96_PEDHC|nr:2,5-diketo-D-gluconic acid reductase A, putative [Pediculus humanus corporis]EEB13802.1 2,5-diketo-D-gluconic acid reductase A, putative [Pediculus humanus corporis]